MVEVEVQVQVQVQRRQGQASRNPGSGRRSPGMAATVLEVLPRLPAGCSARLPPPQRGGG